MTLYRESAGLALHHDHDFTQDVTMSRIWSHRLFCTSPSSVKDVPQIAIYMKCFNYCHTVLNVLWPTQASFHDFTFDSVLQSLQYVTKMICQLIILLKATAVMLIMMMMVVVSGVSVLYSIFCILTLPTDYQLTCKYHVQHLMTTPCAALSLTCVTFTLTPAQCVLNDHFQC